MFIYAFMWFCYGFPFEKMRANDHFCDDSCVVIRFPWSYWDRGGIRPRSVIETAGLDPAVSMSPQDPIPHGLIETAGYDTAESASVTAESASVISLRLWNLLQKYSCWIPLIETAETDPVVSLKPWEPIPQYHRNRETTETYPAVSMRVLTLQTTISNISNCLLKNRGSKILLHCPFKGIVSRDFVVCFLVSIDRSDIYTHQEWVLLLLKVCFHVEFFDFRVWA
jgi:hypothetical protein